MDESRAEPLTQPPGQEPPGWAPGGELTELEKEMCASAAAGDWLDLGGGPFELAEMQAWPAERTIRARVLRHLLIEREWSADAQGVRLRGVRISGRLDFEAGHHTPSATAGWLLPRRC